LDGFETCPKQFYHLRVARDVPNPPTVHTEWGTKVHTAMEDAVRDGTPLPEGMTQWSTLASKLAALPGEKLPEYKFALDRDFQPADWKQSWTRGIADLVVVHKDKALVADYKSGKRFGNEIKHGEQVNLYGLLTFLRYPLLETVHVELWYLDVDEITQRTFDRDQALRFKASFDRRGRALTECTAWPANPNKFSCQWCPYGPDGTGHCTVGVRGK
jgi:hypothetical protein